MAHSQRAVTVDHHGGVPGVPLLRTIPEDAAMKAAQALLTRRTKKTPEERRKEQVAKEGVKQSIYLGYINKELTNEGACLELPMTIVILLTFSVFAMSILQQDKVFTVENGMEFDIRENANFAWAHNFGHKTMMDVNSIADFWSWFRTGYLPLIVQKGWSYSEDYPPSLGSPIYTGTVYGDKFGRPTGPSTWQLGEYVKPAPVRNDYLRHQRILGGIQLHQTIAEASLELCTLPGSIERPLMESWLGKPCMPASDGTLVLEKRDIEDQTGITRTEWVWSELDSMEELNRVLLDMEDGCSHAAALGDLASCRCQSCKAQVPRQPWIDELTRKVEVTFITYNPHYGMYTRVGTNFMFNRGGHIHKLISVLSCWSNPFDRPLDELVVLLLSGGLWILCTVYSFICESRELFNVFRKANDGCFKALKEDYIGFWNMVDWISLGVALCIVILFFSMRSAVEASNVEMAVLLVEVAKVGTSTENREMYQAATQKFFAAVENMVSAEKTFRLGLFAYPSIIMLRLFKSFAAQPRLAIVTKTLQRATVDLIHFCIVFMCVFLCLVVNSILFFGQDVQDFSTFPRAVNSCFRAMFGDWNFDEMMEIGLIKAQIWFWIFMLIMVLILLNMLLAVIMDAYKEEKARTKTAQTLANQTYDIYRRWRQFKRGERVRLNDIWDVFCEEYGGDEKAMLKDQRMLKASYLTEKVPKLQPTQAKRLLENSLAAYENAIDAEITESHQLKGIKEGAAKVELRIEQMLEEMKCLTGRVQYYDRLQAYGDPEYDFHFGSEGRSVTEASQEAISHAVTGLSSEICGLFVDNLKRIEGWQDAFERQQNELHSLVAEMQIMVRQQAWCVAAMAEAVEQLTPEEQNHEGE